MNNDIFLDIAGFNCLLKFHDAQNNFFKDLLIREIKTIYQGFIAKPLSKSADFTLDFYEQTMMVLEKNSDNIKRNFIYAFGEKKTNRIATFYHISLNQLTLIFAQALHRLLSKKKGFFIHSSASNINGSGVLFTGNSGAGKSTVISFLNQSYPTLADDIVIIKRVKNQYYCYQTPLIEKNSWIKKESKGYRVDKIYFLRKATYFKTEKITNKNWITSKLSRQLWVEKGALKEQMKHFLEFVNIFDNFYLLHFAKDKKKLMEFL